MLLYKFNLKILGCSPKYNSNDFFKDEYETPSFSG